MNVADRDAEVAFAPETSTGTVRPGGAGTVLTGWMRLDPPHCLAITLGMSAALHLWMLLLIPDAPEPVAVSPPGHLMVRIGDFGAPPTPSSSPVAGAPQSASSKSVPVTSIDRPAQVHKPTDPVVSEPVPAKTPRAVQPSPSDRAAPEASEIAALESAVARPPTRLPKLSPAKPVQAGPGDVASAPISEKVVAHSELSTAPTPLRISNPVYRSPPNPPVYPARAVRFGQEGTVMVRAHLSTLGEVLDVEVHSSSGHALLDKAALAAVRDWRFEPAWRGGRAVLAVVDLPVNFQLQHD